MSCGKTTPSNHVPLGDGAEFDAIREMLAQWGDRAHGIGDDAAVLDVPPGEQLVTSTDASVEGVHFKRDWLSPVEIGGRATAAALSDLAAMAATPLGLLLALGVPDDWREELPELAGGVGGHPRRRTQQARTLRQRGHRHRGRVHGSPQELGISRRAAPWRGNGGAARNPFRGRNTILGF